MEPVWIFLITFGFIVSLVGIIGNTLVILFLMSKKVLKNKLTRMFFINLAVADMGVLLFCHTFFVLYHTPLFQNSPVNEITCRGVEPLVFTFLTLSAMSLVIISFHRHHTITRELSPDWSQRKASLIITFAWCCSFFTNLPLEVIYRRYDSENRNCKFVWKEEFTTAYVIFLVGLDYVLPFLSITILFLKMRKALERPPGLQKSTTFRRFSQNLKSIRLLRSVVFVFFITKFPNFLLTLIGDIWLSEMTSPLGNQYGLAFYVATIFLTANSAANPYVYVFASRDFRQALTNSVHPL